MDSSSPISFRLKKADDLPFIYASWLSAERANTAAHLTPSTLYQREQTKKIDYLLSISQTMIAYFFDGEEEILLAFMVYQYVNDTLIIHYAFTKSPNRRMGIQKDLLSLINLPNLPIVLSCQPNSSILKNNASLIYDHYYFQRNYE